MCRDTPVADGLCSVFIYKGCHLCPHVSVASWDCRGGGKLFPSNCMKTCEHILEKTFKWHLTRERINRKLILYLRRPLLSQEFLTVF